MSTIFGTIQTTQEKPRHDATIRVKYYAPGSVAETGKYVQVELLEYHPDFDDRLKFRGHAYIKPHPDLIATGHDHIYQMCGVGYLEQPYMSIRELFIHRGDVEEMMEYCYTHQFKPLIIHKCPLPFPVFEKGAKVSVINDPENEGRFAGRTGIIVSSSIGGRSGVLFEDGMEWHFDSLCLRELSPGQHQHDIRAIQRKERKQSK